MDSLNLVKTVAEVFLPFVGNSNCIQCDTFKKAIPSVGIVRIRNIVDLFIHEHIEIVLRGAKTKLL